MLSILISGRRKLCHDLLNLVTLGEEDTAANVAFLQDVLFAEPVKQL